MQFKNIVAAIAVMAVGNTMAAPVADPAAEAVAIIDPIDLDPPQAAADIEARQIGWPFGIQRHVGAGFFHNFNFPRGRFLSRFQDRDFWFPEGAIFRNNQFFLGNQVLCRNDVWGFYNTVC
ncbi:hypothetical protein HII31_13230 [Pseudocercospora fuligena]|uniref:Uncharacterized protein n=1 Tax=Pseudocercospora fuligena TaxID=685502 RepID=A0A8H6R7V9_9PEZI|nr:hypothetical protein HII31_13231 [Pseudocercospora fuligena]KAF7185437.1 hypothetical protein HII31_13230 [Pseudocercospora fuligena]